MSFVLSRVRSVAAYAKLVPTQSLLLSVPPVSSSFHVGRAVCKFMSVVVFFVSVMKVPFSSIQSSIYLAVQILSEA